MKVNDVLGLNSRNHLFTSRYNTLAGKKIANSKLLTKSILAKANVRVPKTYAQIKTAEELSEFDFYKLPADFVVKPNNGLGGQGIVVVEKRGTYAGEWITSQGEVMTVSDLRLQIADILAGQYSMDDLPDIAYIEERVKVHPVFLRYSYHGTPDIRVIVFNKVPVMSYVRLPTEESGGRANLFQGACAVGVDIATGITTYGVHHGKSIDYFPGTRRKLSGIVVPEWEKILETAIIAAEAIGLGYMASDIVLQPSYAKATEGMLGVTTMPMILEVNAQPGLKIQIANRAGLRDRLLRVQGLRVIDAKHGIKIAKALFADPKLMEKGLGLKTLGRYEEISVVGVNGEREELSAKVDTGADISSIDMAVAERLGLLTQDNMLYESSFYNALGKKKRKVVGITYYMAGRKIKSRVSISDRSRMSKKMIIGWLDLKDFAVMYKGTE
ncbi:MAG: sugar-transfer associated ATP-grasp domain-containing protein [bacterium]